MKPLFLLVRTLRSCPRPLNLLLVSLRVRLQVLRRRTFHIHENGTWAGAHLRISEILTALCQPLSTVLVLFFVPSFGQVLQISCIQRNILTILLVALVSVLFGLTRTLLVVLLYLVNGLLLAIFVLLPVRLVRFRRAGSRVTALVAKLVLVFRNP